jgi:carbonic anhydrase
MTPPDFLREGYRRFRESGAAKDVTLLAKGQAPKVMVIACSDARVHPATLFDADPGEIFMVRNVANIVPPLETGGAYHGTSAALEFAVKVLKVPSILVLGHSGCGGIQACLSQASRPVGDFIGPWVELINPALAQVTRGHPDAKKGELRRLLEKANVRNSLKNLGTFPFVREGIENGQLQLLGAWFDIATAGLEWVE